MSKNKKTKNKPAKKAKKAISKSKPKTKVKSKVKASSKPKPKVKAKAKAKPQAQLKKKVVSKPKAKKPVAKAKPKAVKKAKPVVAAKPKAAKPVTKPTVKAKPEAAQVKIAQPIANLKPKGRIKAVKQVRETKQDPKVKELFHSAAKEYNPFLHTKSNQPTPMKPIPNPDERTRYSEEELKEFEVLIADKLEAAKKELTYIKEVLSRKHDPGTDTTAGTLKLLEDGADTAEKENFTQLAGRQQKFIQQLENAMARIKNGTYGICVETGKLIPKERLRAVPHTQHSIEAKLNRRD
jgi:DnaK suppressor protein